MKQRGDRIHPGRELVEPRDVTPLWEKEQKCPCGETVGNPHKPDCMSRHHHFARPNMFIQWQGTDACLDCYCVCGDQFHIDGHFAFYLECPHCKRRYKAGSSIELVELPKGYKTAYAATLTEDADGNTLDVKDNVR